MIIHFTLSPMESNIKHCTYEKMAMMIIDVNAQKDNDFFDEMQRATYENDYQGDNGDTQAK